jgi:hypothetical protein
MGVRSGRLLAIGAVAVVLLAASTGRGQEETDGWRPSSTPVATGSAVGEEGPWAFLCALVGVTGLGLVVRSSLRKRRGPPLVVHLSRLSVGVDAAGRERLESALRSSAASDAQRLRQAVLALRRVEDCWNGVAHESAGPLAPDLAARELVRRTPSGASTAGQDVVVHVLVASFRAPHAPTGPERAQLRVALDSRAALTATQLLAVEVRTTSGRLEAASRLRGV